MKKLLIVSALATAMGGVWAADYTTDVVVIGSGGAGLSAAVTLHDAGKKVIVLEKMAMVGGNTLRAEGGFKLGLGLRVYGAAFDVRDEARESVQPVRGDAVAAVVGEDSRRDPGLFGREALFDEYRLKKAFQFAVGDAHPCYFPAFALVSLSIASQRPLR